MKIQAASITHFSVDREASRHRGYRLATGFFICLLGLFSLEAYAFDADSARDMMGVCATCHGEFGQGGSRGEYPRLAGQSEKYMASQLESFRARKRINFPMFPYTEERDLSDEDIRNITGYLASIKLQTTPPVFKGDEDALTRLQMMDKVMIIPRAVGDIENGARIYKKECASCHAKDGGGRGSFPMLVGQYTNYLMKQVTSYINGERPHDEDDSRGILAKLKDTDIRDILAYLTSIQPQE
ncbi:MAG: c-type cytochrome [Sulfuricella denitrificans]|nr:c-type cytochrome [Sulfuricella denitrificans]